MTRNELRANLEHRIASLRWSAEQVKQLIKDIETEKPLTFAQGGDGKLYSCWASLRSRNVRAMQEFEAHARELEGILFMVEKLTEL